MKMLTCKFFAAITIAAMLTAGCSALSQKNFNEHRTLLRATVTLAVTKVVHAHPSWGKPLADAALAAQQSAIPGHPVTVTDLVIFLKQALPIEQLGPEYDEILIALTVTIVDETNTALDGKAASIALGATTQEVLQWIRTAALLSS